MSYLLKSLLLSCCLCLACAFTGEKSFNEHPSVRSRLRENLSPLSLLHGAGVEDTTTNHNHKNDSGSSEKKQIFPPGTLGPPEPIRSLKIGESVAAYRYTYPLEDTKSSSPGEKVEKLITDFSIERVSYAPDAFILRNFLSKQECERIIADAKSQELSPAETITKGDFLSRKRCEVSWLPSAGNKDTPYISSLVKAAANVLLSRTVLSDKRAGVEDLQVLRYSVGGEFVLHQDGQNRILTVIYYVNGVGGTWFPLARTSNDSNGDPSSSLNEEEMRKKFKAVRANPRNKEQALKLGEGLEPGKDGLLVKGIPKNKETDISSLEINDHHILWVRRGDALAFYNYLDDGTGELDWKALHTGLPTTEEDGVKWIANHWFRSDTLSLVES